MKFKIKLVVVKIGDFYFYRNVRLNKPPFTLKKNIKDGLMLNARGTKIWYKNNKLHREDGPAIEYSYGDKMWYFKGKLHREDGPAIEWVNGNKFWFINGDLHRINAPAVELINGEKEWWIKGNRHREDGPAVETSEGYKRWFFNDKEIDCENNEEFFYFLRKEKMKAFW